MSEEMENKEAEAAVETTETVAAAEADRMSELQEEPAKEAEVPVKEAEAPAEEAEAPAKEAEAPAKEAETPVKEAETPAKEAEMPAGEAKMPQEADTPEKVSVPAETVKGNKRASKKKGKLLFAIAAAVIALILVIFNAPKLANAAVKLFSSPAGYFRHVEGKAADQTIEQFADAYDRVVSSAFSVKDAGNSTEVSLELGKEVRELIEDATSVDFDWLEKVSLLAEADSTREASRTELGLSLNDKQLISLALLVNLEDKMGYMQVPELNKDYLGVDLEEFFQMCGISMDMDDIKEIRESSEKLYKALPERSKVEKVFKRYSDLALSCVGEVEQEKEELTVGDLTNSYTVLSATIDENTVKDMLESILKKLKDDKDVKNIILDVSEALEDVDGDDVYEEFLDALEELEDEVDDLDDESFEVMWKTYVDNEGKILGREIEVDEAEVEVSSLMVEKGSKFAYEFKVKADGVKAVLQGEGKKSGSKLQGDFELKVAGVKLAEIKLEDLKLKDLEEGYFNGTVSVSLSGMVAEQIEDELYGFPFDLKDMVLKITASSSKSKSNVRVALLEDDELLGAISVASENGKADKVKFPENKDVVMVEDESDLLDWVEGIDVDAFLDSLKGKLDDDLLEMIEDAVSGNFFPDFGEAEYDERFDSPDYWD